MNTQVSMRGARRTFLSAHTSIVPALRDPITGEITSRRKRRRRPAEKSFRAWARAHFRGRSPSELSPKLSRIVHGK